MMARVLAFLRQSKPKQPQPKPKRAPSNATLKRRAMRRLHPVRGHGWW
jgi:hypothetical protein